MEEELKLLGKYYVELLEGGDLYLEEALEFLRDHKIIDVNDELIEDQDPDEIENDEEYE